MIRKVRDIYPGCFLLLTSTPIGQPTRPLIYEVKAVTPGPVLWALQLYSPQDSPTLPWHLHPDEELDVRLPGAPVHYVLVNAATACGVPYSESAGLAWTHAAAETTCVECLASPDYQRISRQETTDAHRPRT